MLNTQFSKAFYLCNSFFLIAFPFTANPAYNLSISTLKEKYGFKTSLSGNRDNLKGFISVDNRVKIMRNNSARLNYGKPQILLNKNEVIFAKKYIKNSGNSLVSVKKRSLIPFNIFDSVFIRYGLPVELKYLAVIESELKPTALSRVGARGPWQMMPATARILGLKTTGQCDERTNYYKSTIAAARYLKDLYTEFNDWLLVLAAYNGGPGPVYKAIRESGSKNFWVLQNFLPSESRDHVKKFIATHYYFEGRGSETTLTRAENMKYKKMLNAFVKAQYTPVISTKQSITSEYGIFQGNFLSANFDMKQPIGFKVYETKDNFRKIQNISGNNETSREKFRRLMKESEESLRRSSKIV
ncbi:MAG TPA: lytic transglycosylase domain-containing protein [Puia sp.]|nr:lytic transglycosylase domain-containing protein [Puia sp.]